ncbi:hypothetical protein LRS71_24545 [Rhodococcus pyridinivorans]|uniref:hypothetical protein n=1 Tax=Rhodococcus pyridinivorans TaxID=103816 RepID=UPI001E2C45DB|nr:hypothetical protein [Rhodococcus pyridinivorans]MCD5422683.1 hypothetical protein [Rhodococcus pyridinivorans]
MDNYDDLRKAVDDSNGPLKVEMRVLKRIDGAGRLGSSVLSTMSAALANNGIGHLPPELPSSQDEDVRLYLISSPLGDVITAVLNPTDQRDVTLRNIIGATGTGAHAVEQLRQIRQILATQPSPVAEPIPAVPDQHGGPAPHTPVGSLAALLPPEALTVRVCRTDADHIAAFTALVEALAAQDVDLQLAGSVGYRQTELGQLYRRIAPDKPATVKLRALAAAFCRRNPDWILGQHRTSLPDIRLFHRALPPEFVPLR